MLFLSKTVSLFSYNISKINRCGLLNCARLLSQQQLSVSHQETLTGRIFIYLNPESERRTDSNDCTLDILKRIRQNSNHLHRLSTSEMMDLSANLSQHSLPRNDLLWILRELDKAYYLRLSELSPPDILKLLNVYMGITPSRITEFRFYKSAVKVLHESLPKLNHKDLLQFIFYVGLQKKSPDSQTMLRCCLRTMNDSFIDDLTLEELCIICNSTFKTSTKIVNRALLEKVRTFIKDNLYVLNDSALFITLLKTLRHNRSQDEDLLNTISCGVLFNKTFERYSFPAMCHILALFTDFFYYDEHLFRIFMQQCLKELKEDSFVSRRTHISQQLRGKDIKRFLWIASMFSDMKLVSQSDIEDVIMPKLVNRVEGGEFVQDVDSLVDVSLFLWMLNHRSTQFVPYIFKKSVRSLDISPKSNLRLNLLLHAIYLESADLAKDIPVKAVSVPSSVSSSYQLHKRPFLQRLLDNLNAIRKELNLGYFVFSQEIPHLNIVGITGYRSEKEKAVYVEVLDDYTRIKNVEGDVPVGLMALKLRLLDRLDEGVLVVSEKENEDITDAEMKKYLLDEMKLIC